MLCHITKFCNGSFDSYLSEHDSEWLTNQILDARHKDFILKCCMK